MVARETFHGQIAANTRRSVLLLVLLSLVLVLLGVVVGFSLTGSPEGAILAVPISIGVAFLLSAGAWYAGDALVLGASGARHVGGDEAPQLLNVVRELSLAASIPMPRVWLIDDSAPNAFATGRDPEHASIAVTTGLLDKLDREALQGVIGHELAHVRNFDIRFALLVGVLVGSIALLCDILLRAARYGALGGGRRSRSSSSSSAGGLAAIVLLVAIVLAIVAPLFARLVQLAISRQREYLADATSVELTRNPDGLERALATIAADQEPLEVANRATQHLFIVNPIKKVDLSTRGLFSTHPPIAERIDRLRRLTGRPPLPPDAVGRLGPLA
ncbi:MAG: M48 family metallopeptidase [Chloroflexota bacterium]